MKSSGRLERWAAAILAAAAVSCTDKDAVTAHPSHSYEHLTVSIDLHQPLMLLGTSTLLTAHTTNQKGELKAQTSLDDDQLRGSNRGCRGQDRALGWVPRRSLRRSTVMQTLR
jgi:hypothetical protein